MSSDRRARAHREILAIVAGAGDLSGLGEWLSEGHVLHQSAIADIPPGPGSALALAKVYRRALAGLAISVEDEITEGNRAVARFAVRARHEAALGPFAPTNAPVEATGMLESRFGEDGRAVESWLEVSAFGVLRGLGALALVNPVVPVVT
jgi:hypothetical protein